MNLLMFLDLTYITGAKISNFTLFKGKMSKFPNFLPITRGDMYTLCDVSIGSHLSPPPWTLFLSHKDFTEIAFGTIHKIKFFIDQLALNHCLGSAEILVLYNFQQYLND